MNNLDKMMKKLCPDGVKYRKIEDVANYKQPSKYIVKHTKYDDSYSIPVLTAGQTFILGYTNETDNIYQATKDNPVIIFDDFTGAFKWVDFSFKVKSSAMKLITAKNNIFIRYLYHVMGFLNYASDEHKRLWISIYSQIQIPVPPLEIQQEIVQILDSYSEKNIELIKKLYQEIEFRKKQYEYYRDSLLNFGNVHGGGTVDAQWWTIGEICEVSTGFSNTNDAITNGIYPFFVRSQEPLKKNNYEYDEEAVITAGDGVGVGKVFHYINGKYALHQRAYRIHSISNKLLGKYLYYYFVSQFPKYIKKQLFQGSVPSIRRPMLNQFQIPIPSLAEQKRIVDILDKFDKLCNDITKGLPAEISARQKQYAYYRDKLLNFKEIK